MASGQAKTDVGGTQDEDAIGDEVEEGEVEREIEDAASIEQELQATAHLLPDRTTGSSTFGRFP